MSAGRRRLENAIQVGKDIDCRLSESDSSGSLSKVSSIQDIDFGDIGGTFSINFSSDAEYFAVGCGNGGIQIYSVKQGKKRRPLRHGSNFGLPVTCAKFFPFKNNVLVTTESEGDIVIWDLDEWSQKEKIYEKNNEIQTLDFSHHGKIFDTAGKSEHFPFLGAQTGGQYSDMRCRTTFYTALGRLLIVDLGEDEERFEEFMVPLTATFTTVASRLIKGNTIAFQEDETKRLLVGICRDLTGLALALTSKSSYMMLFEWIYPRFTPVLIRALELWYHDPNVTTPVLKLMTELMHNRSQRLHFGVSSPNGILLFRESSKVLVAYGSPILTVSEIPADRVYPLKLKGISICFNILKAALSGGYVNFGVFNLYGDEALNNALNMFVKLLFSISRNDILDYTKLSHAYYNLLEVVTQDHMNFISNLEPNIFLYILSSISDGLVALDAMVLSSCCATLDSIVSFLFKILSKRNKKTSQGSVEDRPACLPTLELHHEVLQQMLSTVLNIIMFEDCKNQWSMSRPLLGLILLNEEYFTELEKSLVAEQPLSKQQSMVDCFKSLMANVERSLVGKNRDRMRADISSMELFGSGNINVDFWEFRNKMINSFKEQKA